MNYRHATQSDLGEICSLIKAAIAEMERHSIFQWDEIYPAREDFANDIAASSLFVGETEADGAKRIAVVYALNSDCDEEYKTADWKCRGAYRIIHRLCVHPDFQSRGFATQTLKHIEAQAAACGATCIRLDVFSKNPVSLKLYERTGFYKTGEAQWRKGLFFLMEKCLAN